MQNSSFFSNLGYLDIETLKSLPENDFSDCFEIWKKLLHKCIVSAGDYFEGDDNDSKEQKRFFYI